MDWVCQDKEKIARHEEEKKKLLALSDFEAESLPLADRYQRIRYIREDIGMKMIEEHKRGYVASKPVSKTYRSRYGKNNVIKFKSFND